MFGQVAVFEIPFLRLRVVFGPRDPCCHLFCCRLMFHFLR